MAEAIDDSGPPEMPAEPEGPVEPESDPPGHQPVVRAPFPEPETTIGDTPLSAIERLAIPAELSPSILRRDRLLTTAWAASFAALAALGVAGYTERNVLMRHWPASKRVYATLGLAPIDGKAREVKGVDAPAPDAKAPDARAGDGTASDAKAGDAKRAAGQ
jgi:hypothetical protein